MLKSTMTAVAAGMAFAAISPAHAAEPVTFTVTITNVASQALVLPNGSRADAPIAPGVWMVGSKADQLFAAGQYASPELERLAEDGNFEPLLKQASGRSGTVSGMFIPGQSFTFAAKPGQSLSFATMFVQSNDLFFGFKDGRLKLFDKNGKPRSGDLTARVELFDAGTETNQAPGMGPDQAPRQTGSNTGAAERVPVMPILARKDGFEYPAVSAVIKFEVEAASGKKAPRTALFKYHKIPG